MNGWHARTGSGPANGTRSNGPAGSPASSPPPKRTAGGQAGGQDGDPAAGRRGRPQSPLLNKAKVGDVDRKGRVFERPMLLHPKIALYIYFLVLGIGLVSLLRRDPSLQAVGYGAFALGMLVIADSKTTWLRALPFIVLSAALAAGAVALAIGLG